MRDEPRGHQRGQHVQEPGSGSAPGSREVAQDEQRRTAGLEGRRSGGHSEALGLTPCRGGSPGGLVADSDVISLSLQDCAGCWVENSLQVAGPGGHPEATAPRGEVLGAWSSGWQWGWGHCGIRVHFEGGN